MGKEHGSGKGFCLNVSTLAHGCGDKANEQFQGIDWDFLVIKTLYYIYFVLQYLCEIVCRNADPYLFWTNWYFLISSSKLKYFPGHVQNV